MRGTKFGTSRTLNKPIQWLLRDEFSDARAAGAVNGTMATPGPGGARVVTDTESKLSISVDKLAFSGGKASPAWGDPGIWWALMSRTAGSFFVVSFTFSSGGAAAIGMSATTSYLPTSGGLLLDTSAIKCYDGGPNVVVATLVSGTAYRCVFATRTAGYAVMVNGGIYSSWLLVWLSSIGNSSTFYPALSNNSAVATFDYIRVSQQLWLPAPLVSHGFGSSFDTSDGLGHAEGVSGGNGSGGGNRTLTQQIGTWANSAGKAAAATLSGGVAVATVPLSTADVLAKVKITRSAGSGGMVLRWTDANNHLYTEHDGTNAYLKQVLAGSTTTLITTAATYSANAEIVVDLSGVNGRLYWNNALVGSTGSINSGLTATLHGLRSTDTGGVQLDDFVVYAKGTGGEYNLLNRYINL